MTSKKERITIRFSEETLEEIDRFDSSRSETIREAVRQYVEQSENNQRYTDEQLLDALRDLARELDRTPTSDEVDEAAPPYAETIKARFGKYRVAVEKAGLHFSGPGRKSREDRVREYLEVNPTASVSEVVKETEVDAEVANRVLMGWRREVAKADGGAGDSPETKRETKE